MKIFANNKPLLLTVIGLATMAQSIAWEYVRVRPDYRFVISPWSERGYEISQGLVIAFGAVIVMVLAILLATGVIKETLAHSAAFVGTLVAFGVGAALVTDAKDIEMPFFVSVLLAVIAGVVVRSLLEDRIPEDWGKRRRAARLGLWLAGFVVALFAIIGPLLRGTQPFWIFMAVAGVVMGSLSLFQKPPTLAAWRMIINAIVALLLLSMAMSASLRVGLAEAQFAANAVNADIQDLQITSGVLLAWIGGIIAFTGSVGMWAKRRDQIAAIERARKQQAAARESEAQLSVTG